MPCNDHSLSLALPSSRIQLNSEEQWTKALKFMLTNLKWALAWVSSQFVEEDEPESSSVSKLSPIPPQ